MSILALVEDIKEIFPSGVLNIVTGKGSVIGKHIAEHDKIQMVSVTGSVGTGKQVLQSATSNVKPHSSGTGVQSAGNRF